MNKPSLDELVQDLSEPSQRAVLKDYFKYSPLLARIIIDQFKKLSWQETEELFHSAELMGVPASRALFDDQNHLRSENLVNLYGKNYQKLRKLKPEITQRIVSMVGETIQAPVKWKTIEVQNLVDTVVAFDQSARKMFSVDSRASQLDFLRSLIHQGLIPSEQRLSFIFDTYRDWWKLYQSPQAEWHLRLLYKIAKQSSLPVPLEESGELHHPYTGMMREELPAKELLHSLWMIQQLTKCYHKYCNKDTIKKFRSEDLVSLIFSYLQESPLEKPILTEENLSLVENMYELIGEQRCATVSEIMECVHLDIPEYRIVRKLGEGVYKKAYHGINKLSGGERALKVVELSERGQANIESKNLTLDQFVRREAEKSEAIMALGSQHLAQVYETRKISTIDRYVLSEELLDQTLERAVRTRIYSSDRPLLVKHLTQIAAGLAALHQQGIIHGDLTLSNIGIKKGAIKITDFGLASSLGNIAYEVGERVNVGSIITRAPELFDGKQASEKADVWSFGVIAYVMATDEYPSFVPAVEKPQTPGPEREAYEKGIKENIDKIDLMVLCSHQKIPPRLKRILRKCLVKDPQERAAINDLYQTLKNPKNLFHTYYSAQCNEWIEHYQTIKEKEPWWLPFPPEQLKPFDYIFIANGRGDLLHYNKIIDTQKSAAENPFALFPEPQPRYAFGVLTIEQVQKIEMAKPSGMGAFTISPFPHAIRYLLERIEGFDEYNQGLSKKLLLLSDRIHQNLVEQSFEETEEINLSQRSEK